MKPVFRNRIVPVEINIGSSAKFECETEDAPNVSFKWFKDGHPIKEGEKFRIISRFSTSSLELLRTTKDDSGEYTCKASNQHGSDECSASLGVTGKSSAFFLLLGWLSLERMLFSFPSEGMNGAFSSLCWRFVCAIVSCPVGLISVKVKLINTDLFLFFLIPVEQFPPVFISKPDPQTVYVGKRAVMQCVIAGTAPLNVVWLKDNQALPKVPAHYQSSCEKNKHTLEIPSVEAADSGLYVCKVSNKAGTAECHTELCVIDKPNFVRPLASVAAVVGAALHLECQVDEDTGVTVSWTRDGRKVHQSPDYKLLFEDKTVTLDILKTTLKDCGNYMCTVANEAGSASCSTTVKVQGKSYLVKFQGNCSICNFCKSAVLEVNTVQFSGVHFR